MKEGCPLVGQGIMVVLVYFGGISGFQPVIKRRPVIRKFPSFLSHKKIWADGSAREMKTFYGHEIILRKD